MSDKRTVLYISYGEGIADTKKEYETFRCQARHMFLPCL